MKMEGIKIQGIKIQLLFVPFKYICYKLFSVADAAKRVGNLISATPIIINICISYL